MKKVSIRVAIANAIEEMDDAASRYQNQMLRWAKYIEQEIGSKLAYPYKAKAVTVNQCLVDIPTEAFRVWDIIPGDYEDVCNLQYRTMNSTIRTDERVIEVDGTSKIDITYLWIPQETARVNSLLWQEIGDHISFVKNYDGQVVTLLFQEIQLDEKGFWLVNESHIDAIKKYLFFMTAKKFGWKEFKSSKLLRANTLSYIKDLERDYSIAVRHARAEDGRESEFEKLQY